jgi:hypothetical protein
MSMGSRVQLNLPPTEVNRVDAIERHQPAVDAACQAQSIALTAVVKDALLRHYGSFKAAAISMGEMDQGQLTRDLDTGKFKLERLELCDDQAKAFISAALYEAFGNADPKARVLRLIREGRRILDELSEVIAS